MSDLTTTPGADTLDPADAVVDQEVLREEPGLPEAAADPVQPRPEPEERSSEPVAGGPWLVIIDPQRIFADPASDWASPMWTDAVRNIKRLAEAYAGRIVITRWIAPQEPQGSWRAYMAAWPFADKPEDDPAFELVPEVRDIRAHIISESTFGKWRDDLRVWLGGNPEILLTGVSTDCCVLSTALPAADDGATVTVVTDACAGSTPENHAAALHVLGLYPPQISLATTDEVLAQGGVTR